MLNVLGPYLILFKLYWCFFVLYKEMLPKIHELLFSGILRQPKWGHLKDLHTAIKLCEPALIAVDGSPQYIKLGSMQEVSCHLLCFDFIHIF